MNRDVDRGRVTAGDRCSRLFAPPLLNHHAAIHFVRLHASSCLHAGVCSPFRSSLDDEWLLLQGGLHTRTDTDTHTYKNLHFSTPDMQSNRQTHTHTWSTLISTHTNAKGFLMISDRIKRVGSTHWPPYPCKALRLLALMKPLMGSYLNPWMEVTAVWGGVISVDATQTVNAIYGERPVYNWLHSIKWNSINTQHAIQNVLHTIKIKCTFGTYTHPSHSKIHILKVGMYLKKT